MERLCEQCPLAQNLGMPLPQCLVIIMFSDNNDEILFPFKGLLTCFHFLYAKILLIVHALFSSLQFLQQGS